MSLITLVSHATLKGKTHWAMPDFFLGADQKCSHPSDSPSTRQTARSPWCLISLPLCTPPTPTEHTKPSRLHVPKMDIIHPPTHPAPAALPQRIGRTEYLLLGGEAAKNNTPSTAHTLLMPFDGHGITSYPHQQVRGLIQLSKKSLGGLGGRARGPKGGREGGGEDSPRLNIHVTVL